MVDVEGFDTASRNAEEPVTSPVLDKSRPGPAECARQLLSLSDIG